MTEAELYGNGHGLNYAELSLSLDGIDQFRDRNRPDGSGLMIFWKQELNKTSGLWAAADDNMAGIVNFFGDKIPWNLLDFVAKILHSQSLQHDVEIGEIYL